MLFSLYMMMLTYFLLLMSPLAAKASCQWVKTLLIIVVHIMSGSDNSDRYKTGTVAHNDQLANPCKLFQTLQKTLYLKTNQNLQNNHTCQYHFIWTTPEKKHVHF